MVQTHQQDRQAQFQVPGGVWHTQTTLEFLPCDCFPALCEIGRCGFGLEERGEGVFMNFAI